MKVFSFEIKHRDVMGRIGQMKTYHGVVETPTLLPVVNPNIRLIAPTELRDRFGAQMLITNSYIIRKTEHLKKKALESGVHALLDFDGPIMTDSGTFQSYVHGDIDVGPLDIVKFQRDIGVDVATILDIFSTPDRTFSQAKDDMERTIARAEDACKVEDVPCLATTVQGSVYPSLREECARRLSTLGGAVFPIGGVVPLLENYRYSDMVELVLAAKRTLPANRPVHLFGAGHPMVFALATALGCDLFDSSSYAKYAADGRMMFSHGTRKLKEMKYLPCTCPVCSVYDVPRLLDLPLQERKIKLAEHNLYVSFGELRKVKEAICSGTLWELVEERCASHPMLAHALKKLYSHSHELEQYEPLTKKRMMLTDEAGLLRPVVRRLKKRLVERYSPGNDTLVVLPEISKPYTLYTVPLVEKILSVCSVDIAVASPFGPVPLELSHMYPFAQSTYPSYLRSGGEEWFPGEKNVIHYTGNGSLDLLSKMVEDGVLARGCGFDQHRFDISMVRSLLCMQYGSGVGEQVLATVKHVTFRKSPSTGRIRNIFFDSTHVFSIEATSGMLILTLAGARLLHDIIPAPEYRVTLDDDAVPFARRGRTAFCKFVVDCHEGVVPGDRVLLVDGDDSLVAWGKALLNRKEMLDFDTGIAVKVRGGVGEMKGNEG